MSSIASLSYLRPEVAELKRKLDAFVEQDCIPEEATYEAHLSSRHGADRWRIDAVPPCMDRLKSQAKALGLWNLFIPPHLISKVPDPSLAPSISLSYREYGILCESLGRCPNIAPEACNTSAPDTGNMEVLLEFGTPMQRQTYLIPLLRGEIRSTFLMTEPAVASSDPTNLEAKLTKKLVTRRKDGTSVAEYTLTGQKWWSTGAMDPRCRVALVVAKMDYSHPSLLQKDPEAQDRPSSKHGAHTIVAVPMPNPGLVVQRALTVFGYDDAPHGHAEVTLDNIQLTSEDLILGEGSGFRVSQARLGPGRIHHCMRAIGMGKLFLCC
jgi:acyl-CoA dehydrogenase